jgi:hypothetical protein
MPSFLQPAPGSGADATPSTDVGPVWTWSREEIEAHYRQGQCHYLAVAIRRATGLPLGALWNPFDWHVEPDENGEGGVPEIVHVYVSTPDGGVIDILGERSLEAMRVSEAGPDWEACPYGPLTDERLIQLVEDTGNLVPYGEDEIAEAMEVIRRIPELAAAIAAYMPATEAPPRP